MKISKQIILGLFAVLSFSCTNDTESDLIDNNTGDASYNNTVKPIITQNCIRCHSQPPQNQAPMPLVTYDEVKDAVLHRGLIDRISSNDPNFLMPKDGPRLPQSQINQIIAWKDANFPE